MQILRQLKKLHDFITELMVDIITVSRHTIQNSPLPPHLGRRELWQTESGVKLRNAMYLKPRLATEENVHENVEVGDESDDHEVSGAGDREVSSRPAALTRRREV